MWLGLILGLIAFLLIAPAAMIGGRLVANAPKRVRDELAGGLGEWNGFFHSLFTFGFYRWFWTYLVP